MNILATTEISIPIIQIIVFMLASTSCFLFQKDRLGLIISFIFVFNWGFLHSSASFVDMMGNLNQGLFLYLFCGFLVVTLALFGFFLEDRMKVSTMDLNASRAWIKSLVTPPIPNFRSGFVCISLICAIRFRVWKSFPEPALNAIRIAEVLTCAFLRQNRAYSR